MRIGAVQLSFDDHSNVKDTISTTWLNEVDSSLIVFVIKRAFDISYDWSINIFNNGFLNSQSDHPM